MNKIFYDLHIHTCLSPCADDDMTPANIAMMAKEICGLDVIAITDHNSSKNCRAVTSAGQKIGLKVISGMELCTNEEIHCVCLFKDTDTAEAFSEHIYDLIPKIENRPEIFGSQLIMDENDNITGNENILLTNAANIGIYGAVKLVASFGGFIFPAHIDRPSMGILSSLGSFPSDLGFSCYETTGHTDIDLLKKKHPVLQSLKRLTNSDAHNLEKINERENFLFSPSLDISDIITYTSEASPYARQEARRTSRPSDQL